MNERQHLRRGLGWAFFGSAMAAAFMVPWKAANAYGRPDLAVVVMLGAAAAFNKAAALVPALRSGGPTANASWAATLLLALVFALLTLVGNWCSAEAVARISAALLAVVMRCEVILVALLGALLLRERAGAPFWIGAGVAGAGMWLLEDPASSAQVDSLGALLGLGAAACFGSMLLLTRRFITRVFLLPFNALRLWLSVGLWFLTQARLPQLEELPVGLLLSAALAGFFGPFLSRIGALISGRHIPANLTALASLATPVMTLALAFAVLGTLPTRTELLGGSVMLLGVAIPLFARARA